MLFAALGCILYFLVPEFAKTIRDRGGEAPPATQFLLQLSRLVVRYWYAALLLAVPYFLVLRIVGAIEAKSRGFAVFWLLLVWFFGAFILMYWAYALILPFQMSGETTVAQ